MAQVKNNETITHEICQHAYDILAQCQSPSGEFGKLNLDVVRQEDDFRHPSSASHLGVPKQKTVEPGLENLTKPNCSITMIAAEGISHYKGATDPMVSKAVQWFTESHYVLDGWFRQGVYIVDKDPYRGEPELTFVADIRHTATALLAALRFGGSVNFIVKALSNLLNDNCRDRHRKGWKANPDDVNGPSDFYATTYVLASLDFLISSDFQTRYKLDIDEFSIDKLLHEGLAHICALPPSKLGYDGSLPQALRANGALLFFLAPLLSRLRTQYLSASIRFIVEHAKMLDDETSWLDNDFNATVDILAGLNATLFALDESEKALTKKAKNFVSRRYYENKSHHPATLGFILCIYNEPKSKSPETIKHENIGSNFTDEKQSKILFLAADPTDASRLRLGEEFREIQEKLKLAQLRERFKLELPHMSLRPTDITQALLDSQPHIVHFSGHGTSTGALCFENKIGQTQLVSPDALAALFEQFSDQLSCVLLNACYSENQARAIARHVEFVIGMTQEIGDKAAIAFATGFYQGLGAGREIEDAYKLGCVQIRLQGIPEHLTPVLIKKEHSQL